MLLGWLKYALYNVYGGIKYILDKYGIDTWVDKRQCMLF